MAELSPASRPGVLRRAVSALRYTITGAGSETWMPPMQPLAPMAPESVRGRQFDFPVGYNLAYVPRSAEPVGFALLRRLADRCDVLRLVIERQKDLLEALDWSVRPRETRPGERPGEGADLAAIRAIERFLAMPDRVHDWAPWLRMVLEDLYVIDAVSLYRRRDRGGRLWALEPLDGATIKVLLDGSGRRPLPPDPAYQQVLKGIPAVDYAADELLYAPRNPRTSHVYGYSPVEQVIRIAETAIERLASQRAYFTHGNVNDGIFTGPEGWQTDQIKAWQGYWDALFSGNVEQRRSGWWVPAGTRYQEIKQPALKDEFDEWIARLVCFAFSTSPTPFVKQQNRATAETQQQAAEAGGLAPVMAYVKRLVDRVIGEDFGRGDLEFVWSEDREFDPLIAARIDDLALRNGSKRLNEVRDRLGLEPVPGGDVPMVLTGTGYVPVRPQAPVLGKADWDEDLHPRQPSGAANGGEFAPKDSGDGGAPAAAQTQAENLSTGPRRTPAAPDAAPAAQAPLSPSEKAEEEKQLRALQSDGNPYDRRPDEDERTWRDRMAAGVTHALLHAKTEPDESAQELSAISAAIENVPGFKENELAYLQHVLPEFFHRPDSFHVATVNDPIADLSPADEVTLDQKIRRYAANSETSVTAMAADGKVYDISGDHAIRQRPPDLALAHAAIGRIIGQIRTGQEIDRGDFGSALGGFITSIGEMNGGVQGPSEPSEATTTGSGTSLQKPSSGGIEERSDTTSSDSNSLSTQQQLSRPEPSDDNEAPGDKGSSPNEPISESSKPQQIITEDIPSTIDEIYPAVSDEIETSERQKISSPETDDDQQTTAAKSPLLPEKGFRTVIKNGYTFVIDKFGRTTHVEGPLSKAPAQGRNRQAQLNAGGSDRQPNDDGGHFIGRRFNGPTDDFNHFAQDANFNRGSYRELENRWQAALDRGDKVEVEILPTYSGGSLRPSEIEVRYKINGFSYQEFFKNRSGGKRAAA